MTERLFGKQPTSRLIAMLLDDYVFRSFCYASGHGPLKHELAEAYTLRMITLRKLLEQELDFRIPVTQ